MGEKKGGLDIDPAFDGMFASEAPFLLLLRYWVSAGL
jgi:hypothetical protein